MSAVPWENEEKRNYMCIDHIVTDILTKELRKIFKREWNTRYQASHGPWDDTNVSGKCLYHWEQTRKRPSKNLYQSKFQNGDTNQWDCSVLFDAILYSYSIGASLNPTIKKEVDSLRDIRNETKHNTEGKLSDTEFQTIAKKIENAFKSLGISIKEITRIKGEINLYKKFQRFPPMPTHEVVYRNQKVTEICQKLHELHSDNGGQLTYFYISGNAGSGKSQLARQVCENICGNVFSPTETTFVMTLNGKDLNSLHNSYEDFCRRLNCNGSMLESIAKSNKSVTEKIKNLRSQIETRIRNWQRWLLVVDNVENLQNISCLLPQMGDNAWKNGQIILTTQNTTHVPPNSSLTKHVSLSHGMNNEECGHLLSSLSGADQNDPELDEVAVQLDRQPLAIAAAGIYFKRLRQVKREFSWRDYLERLNKKRWRTEEELSKMNPTYSSTMSTAVFLAVEKSVESDFLKHIFQFLSLVSFEEMPLELICNYVREMEVNVDEDEIGLTAQQCSLFLVSGDDDCYIRLHRVVHEAVKLYCNGQETKIEGSPQCANSKNGSEVDVLAIIRSVVRTLFCFQDRKDEEKLFPHLNEFNRAVKNLFPPNEALYLVASAFNNKDEILEIFHFFGTNLNKYFCFQLSIEYQKANLQMSLQTNIPFCCAIFLCLGISHYNLGQLAEAKEYIEKAQKYFRKWWGPNHPNAVMCLNNLGTFYLNTGDLEKAKEIEQEALEIQRKKLGPDHPDTATALNCLGVIYTKTAEWEKAKKIHEEALEIKRKNLGPDHPDTATCLSNLAILYAKTGEFEKAEEFQKQALELNVKQLGPNHPDTAASLNNLSSFYRKRGKWEKAEEFLEKALEINRKKLGPDHPDTPGPLNNLGNLYMETGEWEKAKKCNEEALEIMRRNLGPDHPDFAKTLGNLGILYGNTGEWEKAKNFQEQALEINRKQWGPNHPDTATSLNNLGTLCAKTGKWKKAKKFLEEALEIMRKNLGPDHPDFARSLGNLGLLYEKTSEWEKAEKFQEEALEIMKKNLGPCHPDTASSLGNLATLYMTTGKWEKAKRFQEEALEIRREQLGSDHTDTAVSLANLGMLYMKKGELKKAEHLLEQALEIHRKHFSPNHPHIVACLESLGILYMAKGEWAKAKKFHEEVLDMKIKF